MKPNSIHQPLSPFLLKSLTLLLFISAFYVHANAQVDYSYDNNGNRVANVHHAALHHKKDSTAIKVYPNPTTGQVSVAIASFNPCGSATIYLSDGSGNLFSTQKVRMDPSGTNQSPVTINLASYSEGEYYVRVVMCDSEYSYKVIKNNPPGVSKPPVLIPVKKGIPK